MKIPILKKKINYKIYLIVLCIILIIIYILLKFYKEKFENENIDNSPKVKTIDHSVYGKIKCFDNNDLVCKQILEGNLWENDLYENVFKKYIKDNITVIDCGTYIGSHTILLSKLNQNNDVIGFEMMPEHYKILVDNITLNNLSNVIVFNGALNDKIGTINIPIFNYNINDSNFGGASVTTDTDKSNVKVPTFTLDYILPFINESKPVQFIKIDVEGNEINCLEGSKQLIEKYKPLILVEILSLRQYYQNFIDSNIWKHLQNLGYKLKRFKDDDYFLYIPGMFPDLV